MLFTVNRMVTKSFLYAVLLIMPSISPFAQGQVTPDGQCEVLAFFPFSTKGRFDDSFTPARAARLGYAHTAAALMAVEHFNDRNTVIVPELADLGDCNVTLSLSVVNSETSANTASRGFFEATNNGADLPCTLFAPFDPFAMGSIGPISNGLEIPTISYFTYNENLVNWREAGSASLSLAVPPEALARELLQAFADAGRTHLVSIYTPEPTPRQISEFVLSLGPTYGVTVTLIPANGPPGEIPGADVLDEVFDRVKNTGYTAFALMEERVNVIEKWAGYLDERGLLDNDMLHAVYSGTFSPGEIELILADVDPNSPFGRLLTGAMVVDTIDGFENDFIEIWKDMDDTFRKSVAEHVPVALNHPAWEFLPKSDSEFDDLAMARHTALAYDSMILAGMGACRYLDGGSNADKPPRPPPPPGGRYLQPPSRNAPPVLQVLLDSSFSGASGTVQFTKERTKTRNSDDHYWGVYNIRVNGTAMSSVLTSVKQPGSSTYEKVPGAQFIYRGNQTDISESASLIVFENNYLQPWVFSLGIFLFASAGGLAIACMIAVHMLRSHPKIKCTQPFFQQLLCFGSLILAGSIFTLSWDEKSGFSPAQLDHLCALTPWLFFIGHVLSFSALFTKLWRVDKVLQFRRGGKVTVVNVIGPLAVLMSLTIVMLITWTVVDPWQWNREFTSLNPPETFGQCSNTQLWAFFGPLFAIVVLAEGLTLFFAMKTADVPEAMRETNGVIAAIVTNLQAWFIGLPILAVLGSSSADATYLGRACLIWIFSVSNVAIVVAPKIYRAIQANRNPNSQTLRSRVAITGLSAPTSGTRGSPNTAPPIPGPASNTASTASQSNNARNDVEDQRTPASQQWES